MNKPLTLVHPENNDEEVKLYLYVSMPSSDHKEYIFEKSCSIDDIEYEIEELISTYGEGYEISTLSEYAGMYIDKYGEAIEKYSVKPQK